VNRLFIGVPIEGETRELVADMISRLPGSLPGRPSLQHNWHITLFFLGEVKPESEEQVLNLLRSSKFRGPFTLSLGGLGAFPNPRAARILWLGVRTGKTEISELAEQVTTLVEKVGFKRERSKYTPHVTLSRLKPPEDVTGFIVGARTHSLNLEVKRVILYHSTKDDDGRTLYKEIESLKL
jgi:RNA 2',3'-cyclic 3'-phosphodiesterase